jgi:hypothetical protein
VLPKLEPLRQRDVERLRPRRTVARRYTDKPSPAQRLADCPVAGGSARA